MSRQRLSLNVGNSPRQIFALTKLSTGGWKLWPPSVSAVASPLTAVVRGKEGIIMRNKTLATLSLLILFMPLVGNAGLFGPSDYNECILKSMKGVTSDVAAGAIRRACWEKFPKKQKKKLKSSELSHKELGQLTGKAGLGNIGGLYWYGVTIHNGNKNVTVVEIAIRVTTTMGGKEVSRTYAHDVNIPPQTTATFHLDIVTGDKDADYSWGISTARGY